MKNMILAVTLAAAPAAAQTRGRVPVTGMNALPGLGASFSPARLGAPPPCRTPPRSIRSRPRREYRRR